MRKVASGKGGHDGVSQCCCLRNITHYDSGRMLLILSMSTKHAYRDGWTVNRVSRISEQYGGDINTLQTAPSGLKYVVHYAIGCTIVLPCDEHGYVPETVADHGC